jgi:hypothetical protein
LSLAVPRVGSTMTASRALGITRDCAPCQVARRPASSTAGP